MLIPLVIAFTPNYFVPAATTLKSILDSSSADARYEVICLVSQEIPQRQQEKLLRLAGSRMSFRYVNLSGSMDGAYVDPRYSEAASYRLLLPEILKEEDLVIYIDCDVIVRNDLSELYRDIHLDRFLLAAVYEAPIEGQSGRWAALGCDPRGYFNSGFLVMNLKQMREEGTSAKMMEALHTDYLEFPDQDVLNMVCKGRVFPLPPIYNSIRTFFIPKYKKDFLAIYPEEDWNEVQKHGTIHYTGGKPWNLFSVKFGEWWRTYDSLPKVIKEEWEIKSSVWLLSRLYSLRLVGALIDKVLDCYRTLKSRY